MLATFMEVLDTSVANVALPHIAGSLSSTPDEATWVLTSYLVANAIVLPLSGWFSALFGRKRFYMTCVVLFTVSSAIVRAGSQPDHADSCRILQGLGGGALQPVSQAILRETFPREKQGMAMAVYGMGVVVAPVVGPTLGGWITDNYTWRWIFLINIPVGHLSLLLTSLLIFDPPYLVRKSLEGRFEDRLYRAGAAGHGPGRARNHAGRRPAERLVLIRQHHLAATVIAMIGADRGGGLGAAAKGARGGFPSAERPELRHLHR